MSRVKKLRSAIIDLYRQQYGDIDSATLGSTNRVTIRSFVDGLPLEYRLQLIIVSYTTPQAFVSDVIHIATRQELDKQRYGNPSKEFVPKNFQTNQPWQNAIAYPATPRNDRRDNFQKQNINRYEPYAAPRTNSDI